MGVVSALTASPVKYTYDGKEYEVSPWTIEIMGAYERYLEKKAFDAFDKVSSRLSGNLAERALSTLMQDITAGVYTFGTPVVGKSLQSPENVKYIFFLCLKKNHSDIEMELVRKMAEKDYEGMLRVMNQANADPNLQTPETSPLNAPGTV